VSADLVIDAGGLFTSWNLYSHTEYWTDDDFTNRVAELIRDVVLLKTEACANKRPINKRFQHKGSKVQRGIIA
jgi:hypothetical protein